MCLVGGGGVIQEGGMGVPVAPPVCWTRSAVGPPRSLGWGRDAALGSEGAGGRAWLNQCPEDMKGSALNPQSGRGRKAPPVCAPPPPGDRVTWEPRPQPWGAPAWERPCFRGGGGEVHSGLGVPAGNECSGCAWSPLRTALQGRPPTSPHGCLMST